MRGQKRQEVGSSFGMVVGAFEVEAAAAISVSSADEVACGEVAAFEPAASETALDAVSLPIKVSTDMFLTAFNTLSLCFLLLR